MKGSRAIRTLLSLAFVVGGGFACDGVERHPGTNADFIVEGGYYFAEEQPRDSGGPAVLGAYLTQTTLRREQQDKSFNGVVGSSATSVAIALRGSPGFWTVPVGLPPPESPGALGFDAPFSLGPNLRVGKHELLVWAFDEQGRAGPESVTAFSIQDDEPDAELAVTLAWDTPSDLDLHLELPGGDEIYADNPVLVLEAQLSVSLDVDSNADCVIDGRERERIALVGAPQRGRHLVRVDARSLCGESAARYVVEVERSGSKILRIEGTALPSDTRFSGGRGAGLLVATVDVE